MQQFMIYTYPENDQSKAPKILFITPFVDTDDDALNFAIDELSKISDTIFNRDLNRVADIAKDRYLYARALHTSESGRSIKVSLSLDAVSKASRGIHPPVTHSTQESYPEPTPEDYPDGLVEEEDVVLPEVADDEMYGSKKKKTGLKKRHGDVTLGKKTGKRSNVVCSDDDDDDDEGWDD